MDANRGTVLVVDDLERPRRALANELEDAGFEVVQASDGVEGWQRFCLSPPDVVITDMVMPRADGLDLLGRIRSRSDVPVILFTAHGTVQSAAAAFKAGADDFVASSDLEIDDLVELVDSTIRGARTGIGPNSIDQAIVGRSRPMMQLRDRIASVAALATPVLVRGEPGSGRDFIARVIHDFGSTRDGGFAAVDAATMRPGDRIPECTLFYLDGVERLASPVQTFLAEWIESCEERSFEYGPRLIASSLGSGGTSPNGGGPLVDKLERFALDLPALRDVRDDIALIADDLVERIGEQLGRSVKLSPSSREFLEQQAWPGNASQLQRILERGVVFTRGRQIRRDVLRDLLEEAEESLESIRAANERIERELLIRTLHETSGNISRTAETLGKSRTAVYRLIEKNGIKLSRKR
ncbi:MAG: response regulator [Planctomycetota bacterium]